MQVNRPKFAWVLVAVVMAASLVAGPQPSRAALIPLPEWSNDTRELTPAGGRVFLGRFGNETVSLLLSGLPAHSEVTVSFDLFIIDTWDGNSEEPGIGPDIWDLSVTGGPTLLHTTFSNFDPDQNQAYPDPFPGAIIPLSRARLR
jgi:hypothetical protein